MFELLENFILGTWSSLNTTRGWRTLNLNLYIISARIGDGTLDVEVYCTALTGVELVANLLLGTWSSLNTRL